MTPLIKSHTGAMVPARVGMVVRQRNGLPLTITRIQGDTIHGFDMDCPDVSIYDNERFPECTMLHCPLVAGDEIECMFNDGQWKPVPHKYGDDALDYIQNKNGHIRHADPNLRDAPGFINTQPEER